MQRRRCRRCAHAPGIHTASHVNHKKRIAWVSIPMNTCGSFFYNYGARLAALRATGAPILEQSQLLELLELQHFFYYYYLNIFPIVCPKTLENLDHLQTSKKLIKSL